MTQQTNEGTIQPNGTDKIELGVPDVATKKKTDKEMKEQNAPVAPTLDKKYIKGTPEHKAYKETKKPINGLPTQRNESWTFDTAAMAKQELADAKNKQHRKRGKVANLLRKLGMKEHVEQIHEVNHREYASAGKMHPTMAKHMAVGKEADFYHSSTGDKLSGVVKRKTDKEVHIKAHKDGKMAAGDVHKFSISEELIDELSRDTLLSYANKVSLDSQKHSKDPSKRSGEKASRSITGYARAHNRLEKPVKEEAEGNQMQEELKGGQVNLDKNNNNKLDKQDFKLLRKKLQEAKTGKPVNVDKVHAAGDKPHEEKWEDTKKVKKESFTAQELLQALKEGLWPGTPEHTAKFGDKYKQQQGGGAGVKKGSRYGGSAQKPEKEDDHDADDKPAKNK